MKRYYIGKANLVFRNKVFHNGFHEELKNVVYKEVKKFVDEGKYDKVKKVIDKQGFKFDGLLFTWKQLQVRSPSEIIKYFAIFVLYIMAFLWSYLWFQDSIPILANYIDEGGAFFIEILIEIVLIVLIILLFLKWKLFRS